MEELSFEERQVLLTAVKTAYSTHLRLYREAAATATDRNISGHYRRMANKDANWHAEEMSKLSRLDTKLKIMLAEMREREAA